MSKSDTIYARPHKALQRFAFDEQVVEVFPDMIQRSVPGYATIIAMTGVGYYDGVNSGTSVDNVL